jgi:predicted RNA-binding Zn ribbon-like protein
MHEPNFPVLGQALPVELANTYFFRGGRLVEGLATTRDAREWVLVNGEELDVERSKIDEACRRALIKLRGPVRELLAAQVEGRQPDKSALAALNAATGSYPTHLELHWSKRGPLAERRHSGRGGVAEKLRAEIAEATVLFLAGEEATQLRACPAPGCIGFFVKDHPRREWCSVSCGNRARNARFHEQRRRATAKRKTRRAR